MPDLKFSPVKAKVFNHMGLVLGRSAASVIQARFELIKGSEGLASGFATLFLLYQAGRCGFGPYIERVNIVPNDLYPHESTETAKIAEFVRVFEPDACENV